MPDCVGLSVTGDLNCIWSCNFSLVKSSHSMLLGCIQVDEVSFTGQWWVNYIKLLADAMSECPNTAWQSTLSYQFVLHTSQLFETLGLYQKNLPSRWHTFEAHPGAKYWLQLRTLGRSVWKVRQDIFCWNWHLLWKAVWSIHLCML